MTTFQPFDMERMMSKWENAVEYNLSESGVHPVSIRGLVDDPAAIEELLTTELNYPQTNGIIELRERIAALYPGATPDNVLVTVGCAEANYITCQTVLTAGDEMAMMLPNYMQIWGIAHNSGIQLSPFHLIAEKEWAPDLGELSDVVSRGRDSSPSATQTIPPVTSCLRRRWMASSPPPSELEPGCWPTKSTAAPSG